MHRLAVSRRLHSFVALLVAFAIVGCAHENESGYGDYQPHYELDLAIELLCLAELPCSEPESTLAACKEFAWDVVQYSYPERCYPEVADYTLCLRDTACEPPGEGPEPCEAAQAVVRSCVDAELDNR